MKIEVIMRVQDSRYSDKYDKFRCVVSEERAQGVVENYELHKPDNVYGCWVLVNRLTDDGDFVEVIQ